jgi:formate hydrogenlyase subunit 3/multisubunit Na+/H+ antiporter MnhD subunit
MLGYRGKQIRDAFNVLATSIVLLMIIMLYPEVSQGTLEYSVPDIMGTGLHLKVDMLRYAMLVISGLAWFLAIMFSTQYIVKYRHRNRFYMFFMMTYGFTLGVFMSDNILNLFTFFEGMSLASYALVIHDEDEYSHEAGISYLSMGVAGGMILLMGIFLAFDYTGTLEISGIAEGLATVEMSKQYMVGALLLIGFGIKASMFPLHTWLPQTYTAAPAPATAILSAILLKTGLFGIIITVVELLGGNETVSYIVFTIGLINILFGGFLAVMQRNIKRIIAYSSMSQTGFMLLGIGLVGILDHHGGIALLGTVMYMINHAIFKLLLFFGAGVIYMILREMSLNKIWGFGRHKKRLKFFFLVGIFGIIGMPGFNGYTSKTLIHEAIIEAQHLTHSQFFTISEIIFYFGGALTVAYMMKLFVAIFVEDNPEFMGQYKAHFRKRAQVPLFILAGIIIAIGLFPNAVVSTLTSQGTLLHYEVPQSVEFFSYTALASSFITLMFGAMIYLFIVQEWLIKNGEKGPLYVNPTYTGFNLERNLYFPLALGIFKGMSIFFKFLDTWLVNLVNFLVKILLYIGNLDQSVLPKLEWDRMIIKMDDRMKSFSIKNMFISKRELALQRVQNSGESFKNHVIHQKDKLTDNLDAQKAEQSKKVSEVVEGYNLRLTSITYSLFLLGIVMVLSYIFVFIKK